MVITDQTEFKRHPALSEREAYVLRLAAEGLIDKEIAVKCGVSTASVRTYWDRIRTKLKAANKGHAIALGMPHNHLERAVEEIDAFIVRQIHDEAIFVCDDEHQILTWNKGVEHLLGYFEEEWLGQNASIFFLPEERQDAPMEFDDADRAGASVNDRWHVRKDGTRFWGANIVIPFEPPRKVGSYVKIIRPLPSPQEKKDGLGLGEV